MRLGSLDRALEALAGRPVPAWDWRHHYSGPPDRVLRYLLVLDTVNFSFWRGGAPGEGLRPAGAQGGPPPSGSGSAGGYYELAARLRDVFQSEDEKRQNSGDKKQEQNQPSSSPKEKGSLTREEAERILNALQEDEKENMKKRLEKAKDEQKQVEKDW